MQEELDFGHLRLGRSGLDLEEGSGVMERKRRSWEGAMRFDRKERLSRNPIAGLDGMYAF